MSKDFLVFLIPLGIALAYLIFGNKQTALPNKRNRKLRFVGNTKEKRNEKVSAINLLFKNVLIEFKEYGVLNKNGKVLIYENGGIRNEPRELVFICLNPLVQKSIKSNGSYLVATYRSVPTGAEMRRDFAPILNKYR